MIIIDDNRVRAWRAAYRIDRYLEKAQDAQRQRRWRSLKANIWTAPGDGTPLAVGEPWQSTLLQRLAHCIEESAARDEKLSLPPTVDDLVREGATNYQSVDALHGRRLPTSFYLVRFSKEQYIQDALHNGIFRIAPAAAYGDNSLNPAQQDDELNHHVVGPEPLKFEIHGITQLGEMPRPLSVKPGELFQFNRFGNFYVLCLTDSYDARMFHDFEADAAIVVTKPDVFLKRIEKAMRRSVPDCNFSHRAVRYYDPYIDSLADLRAPFCKNFGFAYQKEYRLVWVPKTQRPLEPLFVNIGSMQDIAFIIPVERRWPLR